MYSPFYSIPCAQTVAAAKMGRAYQAVINIAHLHFLLCTTFSEKAEVHLALNLAESDPKGWG